MNRPIKFGKKDKITFGGKVVPRRMFADPDKDGFPNAVDCQPYNKDKQGPVSWLIAKAKGKDHAEVEKERYAARGERETMKHGYKMTRLQEKTKEEEERAKITAFRHTEAEGKMKLGRQRMEMDRSRQKAMGPMPSMFGTQSPSPKMGKPSLMTPAPGQSFGPPQPTKKKKRKQKKKKTKWVKVKV